MSEIKSKKCSECGEVKLVNEFYKSKKHKEGIDHICISCKKKYKKERLQSLKQIIPDTKICSCCKNEKPKDEFYKSKASKSGLGASCKSCIRISSREANAIYNKQYYKNNKDKERARSKKYIKNNKEKIKKRSKEYYQENKEIRVLYSKNYREKNRELANQRTRDWRERNPDKIKNYGKEYRENNREAVNKNYRKYINERMLNDDDFRIKMTIRNRFRCEIIRRSEGKGWRELFKLTGYSYSDYSTHFNSTQKELLEKYKNTSNYHIDHIIPVNIYNFTIQQDINKCWNPKNLRIVTVDENQSKKNKIDMNLIKQHNIEHLLPEGFTYE